jgi:hypothetical protein
LRTARRLGRGGLREAIRRSRREEGAARERADDDAEARALGDISISKQAHDQSRHDAALTRLRDRLSAGRTANAADESPERS